MNQASEMAQCIATQTVHRKCRSKGAFANVQPVEMLARGQNARLCPVERSVVPIGPIGRCWNDTSPVMICNECLSVLLACALCIWQYICLPTSSYPLSSYSIYPSTIVHLQTAPPKYIAQFIQSKIYPSIPICPSVIRKNACHFLPCMRKDRNIGNCSVACSYWCSAPLTKDPRTIPYHCLKCSANAGFPTEKFERAIQTHRLLNRKAWNHMR